MSTADMLQPWRRQARCRQRLSTSRWRRLPAGVLVGAVRTHMAGCIYSQQSDVLLCGAVDAGPRADVCGAAGLPGCCGTGMRRRCCAVGIDKQAGSPVCAHIMECLPQPVHNDFCKTKMRGGNVNPWH